MKIIISILIILLASFYLIPQAHAIIFLPAILLIPIAKIVAVILVALSIPTVSLGTLWSKLFNKSSKRTITVVLIILFLLAIGIAIFLKIENPNRPLF